MSKPVFRSCWNKHMRLELRGDTQYQSVPGQWQLWQLWQAALPECLIWQLQDNGSCI
jgi:hypothetical protein